MPITALPTPPTRSDPVNFSTRADAFLSALPTFTTEANALQVDVNNKQATASAAATSASASQTAAAASQTAAEAASNATAWVSGTTYAVGDVRYSPTDFMSYRRKTAGAGTTDPVSDTTNWTLLTGNVNLGSAQTLSNKALDTSCTIGGIWAADLASTHTVQTLSNKALDNSCSIGGIGGGDVVSKSIYQTLSNKALDNNCSIAGIGAADLVNIYTNQTIGGIKSFTSKVLLSNEGFSFTNDGVNDTGLYHVADGRMGVIVNGNSVGEVNFNGIDCLLPPSRVGASIAGMGAGTVGSYAILFYGAGGVATGNTYAGSSLRAQGASRAADNVLTTPNATGAVQSGTWRALGDVASAGLALYVRIA